MDPTSETQTQAAERALDPLHLMLDSSGVVLVVILILIVAATSVWLIWFLKSMQLRTLRSAQLRFDTALDGVRSTEDLISTAIEHRRSPGGRVVMALAKRAQHGPLAAELLAAHAKRALVEEQKRATTLMPTLSSIASASPFVGLFGTVWGIMDAFLRIGVEKSASLPVVAPAIGEALIATAFGLFAAIPATVGYNYVDKRIGDLLDDLSAGSEAWVQMLLLGQTKPVPLVQSSGRAHGM
ncbi:MAG TPA: MotA/TolQ/ExbB proton channel family protein [Polyangiaceae bacterium]|jgi:biopolymer transport protein TolQ